MALSTVAVGMVPGTAAIGVAAPLILLGSPVLALRHALPPGLIRGAAGPLLQSTLPGTLGRIVTHPVFCWLASTAVVIGWHVPAAFELALRSDSRLRISAR